MKPLARFKPKDGFALVTTILMTGLLAIIVIATLSLSSITLRTAERESYHAIAKANARMALMIAIGRLQTEAGPDQRITATADIKGISANPQWMGVWKSDVKGSPAEPVWMVSGSRPDASKQLDKKDSALLASFPSSGSAARDIRAEYVHVKNGRTNGRFAFWIGDEGVKARVDVARPPRNENVSIQEKIARAQSPQEPGLSVFDKDNQSMWTSFDPDGADDLNKKLLVSMGTVALAVGDSPGLKRDDVLKHYFNDLTTGGSGLPVNARDGGFKADLSLVFDRSQQSESFVSEFIGAKPVSSKVLKTDVLGFSVTDSSKFGLSEQITKGHEGGGFVGPNWGNLFNYARLWEKVGGNAAPMVGPDPRADSDLRQDDWKPYSEANKGLPNREDLQHTNSGLSPVLSVAQIGLYFGADEGAPPAANQKRYYAKLMVKPIIGLWNPYNVRINDSQYMVEWAFAPYMRLDYQKPEKDGTFATGSGNRVELWLREYWMTQEGGKFPTDDAGQAGSYLRMLTRPVDFEPGEFRLFSAEGNPEMSTGYNNYLVPTLDPAGAYSMRIIRSEDGKIKGADGKLLPDQKKGQPLMIPTGYYGWFGDVYLQDTHWDGKTASYGTGTRGRFPKLDKEATPTWFSLKSVADVTTEKVGDVTHLSRYTNLWNGGRDETAKVGGYIPEPILSARAKINVSGAGGRTPYLIDTLTEGRLGHIGTWRFYTRNPTEVRESSQGLRGWIDSNPRVIASNVKFDGSKNDSAGKQGWNATSNLIPGASENTFGDTFGGNRGLVSDGSWGKESRIPEGDPTPERWRGFGGPASTLNAGGQTHVILYDVPQSPLVSVGQFQHAELSRYNHEPGFVVGNSYANPRIAPDATINPDLGGMGFSVVDISHEVNSRLWDTTFFSTVSPDYIGGSGFDSSLRETLMGRKPLPNPRMEYVSVPGDPLDRSGSPSVEKIIEKAGLLAPQAVAARMRVTGAFNVNSTSKTAWKAVLSSMGASELPVINPSTSKTSWSDPKGIRFNRFVHPILESGYAGGDADAAFWQGWRELSEENLDQLATAIVAEVKERGPFLSMADFVNRNPKSDQSEHRLKGALQAAIDKVANDPLPSSVGLASANPNGAAFFQTITGENQAAGHAAYLLQGDLLQSLAPILQVRSDYFRIRTCGEALDKNGKVIAKATCEAFVQRLPEYVDPSERPEVIAPGKSINKTFGRKFQLVSFRWLNSSEI